MERPTLHPSAIRAFTRNVLRDLRALERMLEEGWIEEGVRRFGCEQEFFLVGEDWRPFPIALRLLNALDDPRCTTELALFNLEANLEPVRVGGRCFDAMHRALDDVLDRANDAAAAEGGHVVLSGSLPTLVKSDLSLDQLTPVPRYHALNEALTRMRGGDYHLQIEGAEELIVRHDSLMLEACNASCQFHLQVGHAEFARLYNTAQLVLAPVLAASVNSPLLFGRRLWAETRIAIFQQSIDTRKATRYVRDMSPRVRFGDRWVDHSVTELFGADLARFKVLMAGTSTEDPFERLDAGEAPALDALKLYNSTIYRWNRPCYGITEGRPHLRIECRAIPSGPSTLDEMANAAFWMGLVLGASEAYGDPANRMDFRVAKSNFLTVARDGLGTGIHWVDGRNVGVQSLILEVLLPLAHDALLSNGVDSADIDRYLTVIEERVSSERTGSQWQLSSLGGMEGAGVPAERMAALTGATVKNQRRGEPVHRWLPAQISDAGSPAHNYARVGQYMRTNLLTVVEDESVDLVAFVMDRECIHHIPVEDSDHRLVGIVSYGTILRLVAESGDPESNRALAVKDVMERDPVSASADTPTAEAISRMREAKATCLPVVEDGRLVGLVTERDFATIAQEFLDDILTGDGPEID